MTRPRKPLKKLRTTFLKLFQESLTRAPHVNASIESSWIQLAFQMSRQQFLPFRSSLKPNKLFKLRTKIRIDSIWNPLENAPTASSYSKVAMLGGFEETGLLQVYSCPRDLGRNLNVRPLGRSSRRSFSVRLKFELPVGS